MADFSGKTYGPYNARGILGTSSLSTVYHATHRDTGYDVALRVLVPARDDERLERFFQELGIIAALEHPYLVPILDHGVQDRMIYLAMPLLTGGTLQSRLDAQEANARPLPSLGEIARFLERMAAALDYIHAEGVVHHHVEPRNILFDESGNTYLSDAGVTKLFKVALGLRSTGSLVSYKYSSPEQWQGQNLAPASDQYSLGAIAYRLVTGKDPFDDSGLAKLMEKHMYEMFMPPHYIRPGVPAQLTMPLVRAMGKFAHERFPTVAGFAQAFAEAIQGAEGAPTGFFE